MNIKHFDDAKPYEAPNHQNCHSVRLAGFEDYGPENFWVGHSQFLSGGGAGPDTSPLEKVYVITNGSLTIIVDGQEKTANKGDTVFIPGGKEREIRNQTNDVVSMIVIMPYPKN
jgi:quercetin dioxygenase-like cupin family protein|tara:strand:+ start:125 stop:466 length:342 start_codon:yes stop_codon:yes gene_type:complete